MYNLCHDLMVLLCHFTLVFTHCICMENQESYFFISYKNLLITRLNNWITHSKYA